MHHHQPQLVTVLLALFACTTWGVRVPLPYEHLLQNRHIRAVASAQPLGFRDIITVSGEEVFPTVPNTIRIPGNDLVIGECKPEHQLIYTDNTIVENSGPSTLNGTLEIYVDSPIKITCVKIIDQITDGSGALPKYNSGGVGHNWVFIDIVGRYSRGFYFKVYIYGVPADQTVKEQPTSKARTLF